MCKRVIALAVLQMMLIPTGVVAAERVERPMQDHRLPELGLEIWTEFDPLWITELTRQGGKPIFTAQTPPLVYPPAAMSVVSFPGMRAEENELEEIATTAITTGATNYGVAAEEMDKIHPEPNQYGVLKGYEATFTGVAQGDAVDVRIFVGHKAGKGLVMLQLYTLEGKLSHMSEHIRRSWGNIKYLN